MGEEVCFMGESIGRESMEEPKDILLKHWVAEMERNGRDMEEAFQA